MIKNHYNLKERLSDMKNISLKIILKQEYDFSLKFYLI